MPALLRDLCVYSLNTAPLISLSLQLSQVLLGSFGKLRELKGFSVCFTFFKLYFETSSSAAAYLF